MAAKKTKKRRHAPTSKHTQPSSSSSSSSFKTLISTIQSSEDLNSPDIKRLYITLVHFSLNEPMNWSNFKIPLSDSDLESGKCGDKLKFKDICNLSNILFKELDRRFGELFSVFHDVSAGRANGQEILHVDSCFAIEELTLLLRCCMVILILIAVDQNLLVEKGRVLLSIVGRLNSIELSGRNEKHSISFTKLVSRECAYVNGDCATSIQEEFGSSICLLEPSNPCYTLLCAVLEVFADELLVHKSLREYFMLIDSASSRHEMLFTCHFGYGNFGSVLEVICAHFILSVSGKQAFESFLNRLFWFNGEDFRIPEMSMQAALSLLLNPIMLSAPKMFQAYFILLVSEAIGICMPSENTGLDPGLMDCCLAAFERSIVLYTRHMSGLHVDDHPLGGDDSGAKSCLLGSGCLMTFESLLLPATKEKLCHLIAKSENSWDSYFSNISFGTNSNLVTDSIAYVKDSLCISDESHKDEISSILSCIILRGSSGDISDTVLHKKGETSPQDIYLLASILKLMSASLLQAIWYVRHLRFSDYVKSLEDVSSCEEYDAIVDVVGHFEQFNVHLPIQKFLVEIMQSYPARHNKSKWMFLHFSGLLSLSYVSGLDFLVKDCLFMMMTLLNLFIIEWGDLSAVGSLLSSRSESFSPETSDRFEGSLVVRRSSRLVSSKIQKIQKTYLRTRSFISSYKRKQVSQAETSEYASVLHGMDSTIDIVEDTEETCNGEIFLKCVLGRHSQRSSDLDDLADFIECRKGKDYSGWLRDRQRFRLWKYKKMTISRWKKKKMSWNYVKGR